MDSVDNDAFAGVKFTGCEKADSFVLWSEAEKESTSNKSGKKLFLKPGQTFTDHF